VLDVDQRHSGYTSLEILQERHGLLPDTLTVRTGGGGEHRYYQADPAAPIRNDQAGRLGCGLDVRGDGGLVVAPPSTHVSGITYSFDDPGVPVAALPGWLVNLLAPPPPARRKTSPTSVGSYAGYAAGYAVAALCNECANVVGAIDGTRNDTLNRAAFAIGTLVGAGQLPDWAAAQQLLEAALSCGLGESEARATILSGLRSGVRHPRAVSA
jgi:hypothetical protein